jgi:signal transduction histidine kinase
VAQVGIAHQRFSQGSGVQRVFEGRLQIQPVPSASSEPAAAFLQSALTVALAVVCAELYRRYRKPYFAAWALAWLLYSLRLAGIIVFLLTEQQIWLYWHQVATGWTGLALLWAALVFSQRVSWRRIYLAFIAFPVLWSYVAIYRLDDFLLAAGPAVAFLSGATLWTAWVFFRHNRRVGSSVAAFLAAVLLLWGLHHLDYPFLRARGVWNPWGYYIDIVFELATGAGMLMLVGEDLDRGLHTLSALSAHLQPGGRGGDFLREWLERALTLSAVRGSALWVKRDDGAGDGSIIAAAGGCAAWEAGPLPAAAARAVDEAVQGGRAVVTRPGAPSGRDRRGQHGYIAALPVLRRDAIREVLLVVGEARDPFAALDTDYLVTLGRQLGAALENAELYQRLAARTAELERIAARLAHQHEDERRRLSRELHDETAQVLAALNMQLGILRESAGPDQAARLDRLLALLGEGIHGIRSVTNRLRPPLLDDLGLLAALRGLVDDFAERNGIDVRFAAPASLPRLPEGAELALFRALQEALSNVARHAAATSVNVTIASEGGNVCLRVRDDGRGLPADVGPPDRIGATTMGSGLDGMRERVSLVGGSISLRNGEASGVELTVIVPLAETGGP